MKVLLVHEFYRSSSPSGEDGVFRKEHALLSRSGFEVEVLAPANDWIGTRQGPSLLKTALSTPWSLMGRKLLRDAMDRFRPDLVHFHNTFPVLSQAAVWEAHRRGAATVQTLHNYRWFCANALLLRRGTICELCLQKGPWPALRYRCYRNSLAATLPLVVNIALHRRLRTAWRAVDQLVVLTAFAKSQLVALGLPSHLMAVKPNFFDDPYRGDGIEQGPWSPRRDKTWVYIGRLKEEKGIQFLPRVWQRLGADAPVLRIIGDGPMRDVLAGEIQARGLSQRITLEGYLPPEKVQAVLYQAGLLVFPSVCYEGFPLTIGEAYAAGVPVAGSRIGAVATLVREHRTGILFEPGDVADMTEKLARLRQRPGQLEQMGRLARKEYEMNYTPQRNIEILADIYRKALQRSKKN